MNAELRSSTKPATFFVLWVILTGAATIAGRLVLEYAIAELELPDMLSTGIFLGGTPLLASLVQWPLFIPFRKCMHWWAPATLLGSLLNGLIGPFIVFPLILMQLYEGSFPFGEIGMSVLVFICLSPSGLIIGLTQWLVLRKNVHRSGLWVLTATLCWSITNGLIFLGMLWFFKPNLFVWINLCALPSTLSGIVMIYLLFGKNDETAPNLTAQRSPDSKATFFTQWLLVTVLATVLSMLILRWIQYHSGYSNAFLTSLGLSFALPTFLTASAQWLVLRTQIREERAWIPVTLLGCLFILMISPVLYKILISILENSGSSNSITTSFFALVITSLPSFILASLQYLALETKVTRAALWIPTIIVVRLIGGSLSLDPVYFLQFVDLAIRGYLQGLITGSVMTFMIFQSRHTMRNKTTHKERMRKSDENRTHPHRSVILA